MGAAWNLESISAAFTNAAVDPTLWNAAMETVREVTGCYGVALLPYSNRIPFIPSSQSLSPALDTYIRDGWMHRDERYKPRLAFENKLVITEFDFTSVDEIAKHPYYQEFLAPFGLRWFAGVRLQCGSDQWCLSVQNSIEQGPFSPEQLEMFESLGVRLSGVAGLARTLGFAKADAALDSFQVSGTSAILIDRNGRVVRANAAAEGLLGSDLQIRSGQIISRDTQASATLHRALHRLAWAWSDEGAPPPIILPRERARPILAYPVRLASLARDAFAPAQVVIILIDLGRPKISAYDALRFAFGLTPAEARLTNLLSAGESLANVAEEVGISYETARNQLKSVFAKTNTCRQGELVALVARLAVPAIHLQVG